MVEKQISYKFKNTKILKQALTHASVSSRLDENYERLEFLGDRVLGVAVANLLYRTFTEEPEGSLSQRHVALVCKEAVAEVALMLGLNKEMFVDNNEIRNNDNVLCDVCEALIGAMFVDGGFDVAVSFVEKFWTPLLSKNITPPKDAKTRLQEIAHVKGFSAPVYEVVNRSGTEHEPIFEVCVCVGELQSQKGKGRNKKLAEQEAAAKMLEKINGN